MKTPKTRPSLSPSKDPFITGLSQKDEPSLPSQNELIAPGQMEGPLPLQVSSQGQAREGGCGGPNKAGSSRLCPGPGMGRGMGPVSPKPCLKGWQVPRAVWHPPAILWEELHGHESSSQGSFSSGFCVLAPRHSKGTKCGTVSSAIHEQNGHLL